MYDNQEMIDEENRKLKEIDSDYRIGSVSLDGNKVICISITVPIKGNAEKIKRLEADGWERTFRKKSRDIYGNLLTDNRIGIMLQCMRKDL